MTFDVSTRAEFDATAYVVSTLRSRVDACGSDLLVVGAAARDLLVTAQTGALPLRATDDIDVAIAVSGWEDFRCVTESLTPVAGQAQRFLVKGIAVDIVPFGGVEEPDGTIHWVDGFAMSVLGFAEARATAVEVVLPGGVVAAVADIPAQVVLKLMAWRDRGQADRRDAVDVLTLLEAFTQGERLARLYDEHPDSLQRHGFDLGRAAADAIGSEAAAFLGSRASSAVTSLLDRECGDEGTLPASMGNLVQKNRELLLALRAGLRHPDPGRRSRP